MAIYKKETVQPFLDDLDRYYSGLRNALAGSPPNTNTSADYNASDEQFSAQFTDINLLDLRRQLGHFKVSVEVVRELLKKEHQVKRNHRD